MSFTCPAAWPGNILTDIRCERRQRVVPGTRERWPWSLWWRRVAWWRLFSAFVAMMKDRHSNGTEIVYRKVVSTGKDWRESRKCCNCDKGPVGNGATLSNGKCHKWAKWCVFCFVFLFRILSTRARRLTTIDGSFSDQCQIKWARFLITVKPLLSGPYSYRTHRILADRSISEFWFFPFYTLCSNQWSYHGLDM